MPTLEIIRCLAATLFIFLYGIGSVQAAEEGYDPTLAPDAPLHEQVLSIPGDPTRPVTLQVTLYTPNGPGPFPLAVMNHGATGGVRPDLAPRYRFTFSAWYFLSRGYAVALPMMRGFAGSGSKPEMHGCDIATLGINNGKDIGAVVDYFVRQPYIDGSRVVVAGQSFGGWNTLAFGTLHHPRVKALINFAGGVRASDCYRQLYALTDGAAEFGEKTVIPSLWLYGDNDQKFPVTTWRAMYERYTAAGGKAELVAYGAFMEDSHNLLGLPEGLARWAAKADAFLERAGLPGKLVNPEYMPAAFPAETHYATVDDSDAVPYVREKGRQLYRQFLSKPMSRAFVVASSGSATMYTGGFDPVGKALANCRKTAANCQLYAVDDRVVWRRPSPVPPPTHYAALDDVGALPHVGEQARQDYQKFLAAPKPRAFVIAPDGGWAATALGDDPAARALALCGKAHLGCQVYAVDNQVVWPKP